MAAILTLRRSSTTPNSLEPSELFFNSGSNILNIGGQDGTPISLVKIGSNTGNVSFSGTLDVIGISTFSAITGSNLYITENVTIDGNIHIGGNITLGSGSDGDIVNVNAPLSGSIIPTETSLYDIGSTDKKYRNLYVVSASIDNISLPGSGILSSSNENFTDFSQSVDSRLDNLQSDSASQDNRLDNLETFSSSQESKDSTLGTYTSSVDVRLDTLESITGSYATTGSNVFFGNQEVNGDISIIDGEFSVITGSGDLTSSLSFTHNITSPNDGNATFELRHNNDLYNDNVAIQLKTDFAGAYFNFEKDGVPYSVLSVQPFANNNIYIHRDTRLLFSSLRIDNNLTVTGSLIVATDVYSPSFSGSFTGSFSGSLSVQDDRLDNLESFTSSQETKNTTLGTYTSSVDDRLSQLETNTGSQESDLIELFTTASDHEQRIDILELFNLELNNYTSSTDDRLSNLELTSESHDNRITELETNFSTSLDSRLDLLENFSSSEYITDSASFDQRVDYLEASQSYFDDTFSGSVDSRLDELEGPFSSSINQQLTSIHSYTASLKQAIDVSGQNLVVYGDLTVQGTTTTLNTTELVIEDKLLSIASGSTTSAEADGAGLHISGADASMLWDDINSNLVFNQKVSSSVGFKGDGSELTGVTATDIDFYDISNKPPLISGSSQVTFSLDMRYLEIDGDDVVSGSSQITITDTTGFTTFSGSLKSTDDGQDSRLGNLESFTSSQETKNSTLGTLTSSIDNRLSNLESRSGSQEEKNSTLATYTGSIDTYITNLVSFTSSQEEKNSTLQSYTESVDSQFTELYSTASNHEDRIDILESFSSSIDTTIKNKLDFEGVVSSSLDTTTISLSIQDGVISGDVIGGIVSGSSQVTSSLDFRYLQIDGDGVVSGSDQVTESLDLRYEEIASGTHTLVSGSSQVTESLDSRYEVLGSVSDLVGVRAASGSLGSAAWYNVSGSISDGNPAVIGNAGAVKDYIDEQLLIIGAGDITSIIAGDGISGGADSGPATLTLDTGSQHFIDGVTGIAPTLPNGLVSGSTQVITLLNGSGILSSSIETFEEFSSSVDLRFSGLSTDYNDLENIPSGIVSGSSQVSFNGITDKPSLVSGSSQVLLESANKTGFSGASSITTLGTVTSGDVTAILPSGVISGSSQVDLTQTTSYVTGIKTRLNVEGVISGSSQVNADSITNFDSNVKDKLNADGVISGSSQILLGSGIVSSSQQISDYNTFLEINGDNVVSSSQQISNYGIFAELSGDNLVSSSAQVDHDQTTNFVANKHIDHSSITIGSGKGLEGGGTIETNRSLSLNTGSAHFTDGVKTKLDVEGVISGSDQLTGSLVDLSSDQTINGTKTFNDIVVNGTGSFAYITSVTGDAKIIGDAFIVLNTNTPTSRYAGLSVYDSGSTLSTASFYFDGQTNDWGYEYSSSTGVDYAVTIFGPEYSTKGNPTYLTTNKIPKAVDNHHLNDSNITDDGTTITLGSNVQLNGNLNLTGGISGLSVVSGSDQVLGGTGIVSSSAQIKPLLPSGTVSGSVQVSYPSLSNIPAGIVSGSTQIKPLLPSGIVSGSIQVSYPSLSNIPSGIVSGSVQITKTLQEVTTAGNTTSTSISITNSTASTSKTTGALIVSGGIGTSGDVFAGGDVVAYSSSDRRLKDNIQPIQNPLEKINQIGGYSFEWNVEKQNIYSGKDYGVIAQEIEEILPELVENRENGYKAVKYDKLVSLLIEGIKDLSQQVEELKQKINKG